MYKVQAPVVIAHEWLTNAAGSESVVRSLSEIFPAAPIVCSVADSGFASSYLPGRQILALLDERLPGITTNWVRYAPLIIASWLNVWLDCKLLIISSHFAAHQAARRTTGRALAYYHSPMRIAWRSDLEEGRIPPVGRMFFRAVVPFIRRVDAAAAKHVAVGVANSSATATRVARAYGRHPLVVHPPVSTPTVGRIVERGDYYLYFGRLVSYKRPELAVRACNLLRRPLIVAGYGPLMRYLREIAGPTVTFVERPTDEQKWQLLRGARALLFPGEEDFGIVPVEALSAGTPVVGLNKGGLVDSVDNIALGELYSGESEEDLARAIARFERRKFDELVLKRSSERFSDATFKRHMTRLIVEEFGVL